MLRKLVLATCFVLFVSPIDKNPVPDIIPIIGWVDELLYIVLGTAAYMSGPKKIGR